MKWLTIGLGLALSAACLWILILTGRLRDSPATEQIRPTEDVISAAIVDRGRLTTTSTTRSSSSSVESTEISLEGVVTRPCSDGNVYGSGDVLLSIEDSPRFLAATDFPFYRPIGKGSSGADVRQLQQFLSTFTSDLEVDGVFGEQTASALSTLYSSNGFVVPTFGDESEIQALHVRVAELLAAHAQLATSTTSTDDASVDKAELKRIGRELTEAQTELQQLASPALDPTHFHYLELGPGEATNCDQVLDPTVSLSSGNSSMLVQVNGAARSVLSIEVLRGDWLQVDYQISNEGTAELTFQQTEAELNEQFGPPEDSYAVRITQAIAEDTLIVDSGAIETDETGPFVIREDGSIVRVRVVGAGDQGVGIEGELDAGDLVRVA